MVHSSEKKVSPQYSQPTSPNAIIFDVKKAVLEVSQKIGLKAELLENQVRKILKQQFHYFPVRHHSPASSWYLLKYIEKLKPEIIFMEAPSDCENLIPFLVDSESKPPIAIYTYFKDDTNIFGLNGVYTPELSISMKFRAWYPFMHSSPEFNLMEYCTKHQIPLHFIDAPYLHTIEFERELTLKKEQKRQLSLLPSKKVPSLDESEESGISEPDNVSSHDSEKDSEEENEFMKNIDPDKNITQSNFFQEFCKQFNVPNNDIDEVWDLLFEVGAQTRSIDYYIESMLLYCTAIRFSLDPTELIEDSTLFREQYMQARIESILKQNSTVSPNKILIVTGGLHSIALLDTKPLDLTKLKPLQGTSSLIPYSFLRLSNLTGYGAGNKTPSFYEKIWLLLKSEKEITPYTKTVIDFTLEILNKARHKDLRYSTADTIAIINSAQMLASLRLRPEPNVRDLHDALLLCCIKGNPQNEDLPFQTIIDEILIGNQIGRITKKYKIVGIQRDFYEKLANFGFELKDKNEVFKLDLHDDHDRIISNFFWQLDFMEIGATELLEGPSRGDYSSEVFHEHWRLSWNPTLEGKLSEKSVYGNTIEEASLNLLKEKLIINHENAHLGSDLFLFCLNMGLSNQIQSIAKNFVFTLDIDRDFFHLTHSFKILFLMYRIIKATKPIHALSIEELIIHNYYALCTQLMNIANVKSEKEDDFLKDLKEITNLLITGFLIRFDPLVFDGAVSTAYLTSINPHIQGAFAGVRYLLGTMSQLEIKAELLSISKGQVDIQIKFGDFVRGLLEICHSKIIFESTIVSVLIKALEDFNWNTFLTMLPGLRHAFSLLSPRDFETFVEKIAMQYGLKSIDQLVQIEVNAELRSIITVYDDQVRQIMDQWLKKKGK